MPHKRDFKPYNVAGAYCVIAVFTFLLGLAPVLFNIAIDPYELAGLRSTNLDRKQISEKAHYPLWKFSHYPREQASLVVLGDSRARSLRDKYWHELGAVEAFNFAYGGTTIYEIYDTFNYVKQNPSLKTLVVGIQLRSFDPEHKEGLNRVPEAISFTHNPLKYYSNWFVSRIGGRLMMDRYGEHLQKFSDLLPFSIREAKAEEAALQSTISKQSFLDFEVCERCVLPENIPASIPVPATFVSERPFTNRLRSWARLWTPVKIKRILGKKFRSQVEVNARSDWKNFQFSEDLWRKLEVISKWSHANDVDLVFVIPATIIEMQNRITEFGYAELNHRFRQRLTRLGIVFDFDYDNPVTRRITSFDDAYHANSRISKQIVGEIAQYLRITKQITVKALKRRKEIICPVRTSDIKQRFEDEKTLVLEGHACRIWSAKHG